MTPIAIVVNALEPPIAASEINDSKWYPIFAGEQTDLEVQWRENGTESEDPVPSFRVRWCTEKGELLEHGSHSWQMAEFAGEKEGQLKADTRDEADNFQVGDCVKILKHNGPMCDVVNLRTGTNTTIPWAVFLPVPVREMCECGIFYCDYVYANYG